MARLIGIRHRLKAVKAGEKRSTMMAIKEGEAVRVLKLDTDDDELDFVRGRHPVSYREVGPEEDVSGVLKHHLKKKKRAGSKEYIVRAPAEFDGLKPDDTVLITTGSGDPLAYALARRGQTIGAKVFCVNPFQVKDYRTRKGLDKEEDYLTIIALFEDLPAVFFELKPRDLQRIFMRETFRLWQGVQKDRLRCEKRLYDRAKRQFFVAEKELYPEGTIEDAFDEIKANDRVFASILKEEKEREAELRKAVRALDVWRIFEPVDGIGELLAARLLAPVMDVRRFDRKANSWRARAAGFKHYCGVHVGPDGSFPRHRLGQPGLWSPDGRMAFWLMIQQFIYRPDSEWGKKFREIKTILRAKHPEPELTQSGKKKYTDVHIHRMAMWRTATRLAEWIFREWMRGENKAQTVA